MSSIDERVVAMKFQNSQFQQGVAETNKSLEELKKGLNLENVGGNLDNIASKFSAFGAIAFTALQGLTNAAIGMGKKIAAAVLDPLIEGGKKRSLNIEQAKFQFKGLGMDVEQSMADALYAVKGTAFGLDEAAVAASQFGASGVKSGSEMQAALRGISGVAAMAGSSYSDMANVFTKVAGQGRVMGDDLNRLGARGINAAATLGKAMGKSEEEIRKMVSKGQISFNTFSKAMSDAFGEHATKANETYTGSLSNMRAAFSRIGATTFTAYFERQRNLFNALTPAIDAVADALKPIQLAWAEIQNEGNNNLIHFINGIDFSKLQEVTPIIIDIMNLGKQLIDKFLAPIRVAFQRIFPPVDAASNVLLTVAEAIKTFMTNIQPSGKTLNLLQRTFAGFFAVLDIGWMVIKQVATVIKRLFDVIFAGSGQSSSGILEFTAGLGDFLVKIRDAIKSGEGLAKVFKIIGDVLLAPIVLFKKLFAAMSTSGEADSGVDFWERIANALKAVWEFLKPVTDWFVRAFGELKTAVSNLFKTMDFNSFVGILNAGLLGGLIAMVFKFIHFVKTGLPRAIGSGILGPIRTAAGDLAITLKGMQAKLKAETLMKIAGAIALLAVALFLLSLVDPVRLTGAVLAMGTLMLGLIAFMQHLDTLFEAASLKDSAKMAIMIGSLTALGVAMLLFAGAVAIFAAIPFEGVLQGVGAIIVLLAAIAGFSWIIGNQAKLMAVSITLGFLATGLAALGGAVAIFAAIPFMGALQGVGAIIILLAAIAGFSHILGKNPASLMAAAVSLLLVGTAMGILAKAVAAFAEMSVDDIAKGFIAMGGALLIIGAAMASLPTTVIVSALAVMTVAAALGLLVKVMKSMAKMSWEEIGKSLVVLAAGLLILAGAMALMGLGPVLLGSVALMTASIALMMLAPALVLLGSMSWEEIGRGLAVLASAIGILAVGGILLIPAIPAFLAIGIAVMMMGAGAMMAASGLAAIALAIIAIAGAATVGIEAIKMVVLSLIDLIPAIAIGVADGITAFIVALAANAGEILTAFVELLTMLLDAIIMIMPKVGELIQSLVDLLIQILIKNIPELANAGWLMLLGLLKAIEKNIPKIIPVAGNIISEFIRGLGNEALKIAKAGGDTVIKFMNGLTDYIRNNTNRFITAGTRLFRAIIDGVSAAIRVGGSLIREAGAKIGDALIQGAMNALGINSPSKVFRDDIIPSVFEGIIDGNKQNLNKAKTAGSDIGDMMLYGVKKSLEDISDAIAIDPNMRPTITPVLDLSNVRKNAGQIGGLLTPMPLSLDNTISYANSTARAMAPSDDDGSDDDDPRRGDTYNFNQYNSSPKSLSESEIYRQTKNQISVAKGALTK